MAKSPNVSGLTQTLVDGLKSRTLTTCTRWAEYRRVMGAPFPGPYSCEFTPWVREIQDSTAPVNVAMKGAQLGVTEGAINRALYIIDILKRDVLYVLPNAQIAADFAKTRFDTALQLSPYLNSIFTEVNTVSLKQAGSNNLYIRGSRGEGNLVSIPVSELILDEVDRMDKGAIELARKRLDGQLEKHIWAISTPTVPEKGIHKLYKASTQEHYNFICPSCSRWTELIFPECLEICGESPADPRCADSFLKCLECKRKINHEDKKEFLAKGKWVVSNHQATSDNRGFYINQLYSIPKKPSELAIDYHRGFGDEKAAREFYNSDLGLPFVPDGSQVTETMIERSLRNHTKQADRPESGGDRIITMGVDQGKWSYVEICEWFHTGYSNDLNASAQCKVLWEGKFFETEWHILDALMREWQVLACVIDADPAVMDARRFARRFPGYVWLCRYRRGVTAREIQITDDEDGAPMATVDRTNWISAALGRFKTDPPRIQLPRDVSFEYREHIKSLVGTYEEDEHGNPIATFTDTGPDHFAHARTYAEIALPLVAMRETHKDVGTFL